VNKVYGVAVIGCGYIGCEHIEDIYYRDNVHLVAVVDQNMEKAQETAHKYGAGTYEMDYRKVINRPDVDIVIIATYVDTHLPIMEACVKAGKHVLCEKPVAASKEQGMRFFEIAEQAQAEGIQVMVGHILRHNRSYQTIYEYIKQGIIGELKLIHFIQNHHALVWERYKRLLQDCSPIVDCGVHYLDVMQWMSRQQITEVNGWSCKLDADAPCDNFGCVQITLSGGCKGLYESGWSKNLKAGNCKEFIGEKGYIRLTLQADRIFDKEEGDLIEIYHSDTGTYKTINLLAKYKDMYAQFQELVNRIKGHPHNDFSLQDARNAFMAAASAVDIK